MNLNPREKVFLVIMISVALISLSVSVYLGINQTCTNIKDCINNKIGVIDTGSNVDKNFKEKYEGLKNKIGKYDVVSYNPPMHSGTLSAADWNQITQDIQKMYNKYDAFVLLASHDSIPYTASALAFMLENLGKPIVFSDGDLSDALVLASQTRAPEVSVAFNGKLFRGTRTVANASKGFWSPHYPPLDTKSALSRPKEIFQPKMIDPRNKIDVIKVYPGMNSTDLIPYLNKQGLQGIILELWGEGSGPNSPEFFKVINELAKKGVVIVAVSQYDHVGYDYEIDVRLLEAGVLSGHDMTTPAAYAKLAFLLSNVKDKKLIGQLMDINFRGEQTLPYKKSKR